MPLLNMVYILHIYSMYKVYLHVLDMNSHRSLLAYPLYYSSCHYKRRTLEVSYIQRQGADSTDSVLNLKHNISQRALFDTICYLCYSQKLSLANWSYVYQQKVTKLLLAEAHYRLIKKYNYHILRIIHVMYIKTWNQQNHRNM